MAAYSALSACLQYGPGLDQPIGLTSLYEADGHAWLLDWAPVLASGRLDDLDLLHPSEFLTDMARRDGREVRSRLAVLLLQLLKQRCQSERNTVSWQRTIIEQQDELANLPERASLRAKADDEYAPAHDRARRMAAAKTGLPIETFPVEPEHSLERLLVTIE